MELIIQLLIVIHFQLLERIFIGESHTRGNTGGAGGVDFSLIRNDITGSVSRIQETEHGFFGETIYYFVGVLLVDHE